MERDLTAEFGSYSGAFALYDEAQQRWLRYQPEQCRIRTSPCSTFKVLNSLIALETGVASGADFTLPWDGTRRSIASWNQNQTLRSAFSSSCVWYYQALATRIGLERYHQIIPKVGYGNNDLTGGVTQFWLQSSLTISPDEQVDFLRRLHARKLPFAAKSVAVLPPTGCQAGRLQLTGQLFERKARHHDALASWADRFPRQDRKCLRREKERPETWLVHR